MKRNGWTTRTRQRLTGKRIRQRRGVYAIELILTLPILGIVLMALFEFSLLFFARGSVVEASRVGARKASLAGVTADCVEEEVRKVLDPRLQQSLEVRADIGSQSGDVVAVAVSVPMSQAAPNLLWPIGFTLKGRTLHAETRMIRE